MLRYNESWCKPHLLRKKDNFIGTFKGAERQNFFRILQWSFCIMWRTITHVHLCDPVLMSEFIGAELQRKTRCKRKAKTRCHLKSSSAAVQWMQIARISHYFCQWERWLTWVCLKSILGGKKLQGRATPGKKYAEASHECSLSHPNAQSQGLLYVRHTIHVMYCLLTLLLLRLATSGVTKAGCLGAPLGAQYFCRMIIHT